MRGFAVVTVLTLVACEIPSGPHARDLVVTFDSAPAATTRETVAELSFSAPGARSFTCSLDGATQMECSSPQTVTVTDGDHAFLVRALDLTNAASQPSMHTWLVDTVAPDPAITGPTLTAETSPEFTITTSTPASLRCRIDDDAFEACTSPFTPTLTDGVHTLAVEAEDEAGNVGSASLAFAIDSSDPTVTIVAPLIPGRVSNPQPTVSFTTADASDLVVQCAVDTGSFAACTSGFAASTPLADGPHTYHVRATDEVENRRTVDVAFIVDTTPPTLALTVTPTTPSTNDTPTFEFTVSGQTSVRCELSTGEVVDPCTSPVTFPALTPAVRTFTATATDDAVTPNTASQQFPFEITP